MTKGARALLLALLWMSAGCSFGYRIAKFAMADEYIVRSESEPHPDPVASLVYFPGYSGSEAQVYTPNTSVRGDHTYQDIPPITNRGWVEVVPQAGDAQFHVYVRNMHPPEREFFEVKAATGALERDFPNELRFIPGDQALTGPYHFPVSWLRNVYNDFDLDHGDLLLVEVSSPSLSQAERYIFLYQSYGWRTRLGYQVLFRLPVPGVQALNEVDVGSVGLMASLGVGYRFPATSRGGHFVSERMTGVIMAGVGSTALSDQAALAADLDPEVLSSTLNALLAGAGIQFFDSLSVVAVVNVSAFTREQAETTTALSIGFDAGQFAEFSRAYTSRLFKANQLDEGGEMEEQPPSGSEP